jgi:hypothetical protein
MVVKPIRRQVKKHLVKQANIIDGQVHGRLAHEVLNERQVEVNLIALFFITVEVATLKEPLQDLSLLE